MNKKWNARILKITFFSMIFFMESLSSAVSNSRCLQVIQRGQEKRAAKPPAEISSLRTPLEVVQWRLTKGDLDQEAGENMVKLLSPSSRVHESLLGERFKSCYLGFGSKAVNTIHRLLADSHPLDSEGTVYSSVLKSYMKLFKVREPEAKQRLCVLAGAGGPGTTQCQLFGSLVSRNCH